MAKEITTGTHPGIGEAPVRVGPSVGAEFNRLRAFLIPKACFKLEDAHFAFDSSFVVPDGFDVAPLKDLLDKHPGTKLSIFGHADPTGDDTYNKTLSGRRAMAIFGLLTRDVAVWDKLHDHAAGGDNWKPQAEQTMRAATGLPASTARSAPTKAYMDQLCTIRDASGQPAGKVELTKDDFLARGADKAGKGDVQGCSEFNPLMIFSKSEKTVLDQPANRPKRNEENQGNRRVMVLLFRPGSQVDPAKWPCPTVDEGIAKCLKRFHSDGEKRRSNQEERREFKDTKDTFACRFYDRLVTSSPCEIPAPAVPRVVKIKATVPSTQPNTPRPAPPAVANLWPDPVDLTFETTKPLPAGALVFQDADFATPNALVVVRNGEGPITLEAETVPAGAQVVFQVVRATDDAGALGAALPAIASTGTNTATLAPDERGSFFVLAFVDQNGNGQRDPDETGIILPVILVECSIETAASELRSVANPGNISIAFNTGGQSARNYNFVSIRTGDFDSQATAGVALDADVLLVGGGPAGLRGLDRVFTGWANNFTALFYVGTYEDGSIVSRVQIDNRNQANGGNIAEIPVFVTRAGAPAPNLIAFPPPLLDTGRENPELGGENITFTRSAEAAPVNEALGAKRTVIARDSPGWFHNRRHPDRRKATQLASFVHDLSSTTFLVAWTNTTGGAAPTPGTANSLGFRTFTVVAETQWTVTAQFDVNRVGRNFTLQQTGNAPTITATNVDRSPGVRPATVSMEVRPPETLLSRAIDAR